jgi:hypothetical protein
LVVLPGGVSVRRIAFLTAVVKSLPKEGTTMAPGRTRDGRKAQQWRRWIAEYRVSGLSVRAFCDRRGLATPSFYAWRRTLERRAAEVPAFVLVQVVADGVPAQASALEVVFRDGRAVRVAPGFDAATLRRLLATPMHGLSPEAVKGILVNPIYAGVGLYPRLVEDAAWVGACARLIEEEGAEQFLVNLLYVLRECFPEESAA